jgi:hypothetical protein
MSAATINLAFVAKLVAKPGLEREVSNFLAHALDRANAEAGMTVWFALRTDDTTFWIVDAFPTDGARQARLTGPIAQALKANADRFLAHPPEILAGEVLAAKVPD